MAETRQCGYCRTAGHRRPACPKLHEARNLVLSHTPRERKRLLDMLGKLGFGNGAMIKFDGGWNRDQIGLIYDFEWVSNCSFIDTRYVKYSKQVVIDTRNIEKDYYYRSLHVSILATGDGISKQSNLGMRISRHIDIFNGKPNKAWDWEQPSWQLVVPSHEVDYDPEVLVKGIHMPRRLLLGNEQEYNHRGIMPIDVG